MEEEHICVVKECGQPATQKVDVLGREVFWLCAKHALFPFGWEKIEASQPADE